MRDVAEANHPSVIRDKVGRKQVLAPPNSRMLSGLDGIRRVDPAHRRRGGRVAEGGGLLNRYTVNSRIVGSNPIPSASPLDLLVKSPLIG